MRKMSINPVVIKIIIFFIIFIFLYDYFSDVLQPKWKYPIDVEDHRGKMEE